MYAIRSYYGGISDSAIARWCKIDEQKIREMRKEWGIIPTYKMVDTCGAEFDAVSPYYYSTYQAENEAVDHVGRGEVLDQAPRRPGGERDGVEPRITSYNVCYTKLLRLRCDGDRYALSGFLARSLAQPKNDAIGMVRQSLQQTIRELGLRDEDWSRDDAGEGGTR